MNGGDTNLDFSPVSLDDPPMNFFRALHSDVEIIISRVSDAVQTNPATGDPLQIGSFSISRFGPTASPLVVYYSISGTAINGTDYTDANSNALTGSFVFAASSSTTATTNIDILPIPGRTYLSPLTVTLTILPTNTYLVDLPASATITLSEHLFGPVLFIGAPVGIDYLGPSNSLLVSLVDSASGNFAIISTNPVPGNGAIVTNWSNISSLPEEVKLATVKQTKNGFTNGDMYFSSRLDVGWLSVTGTNANLNWCGLTNENVTSGIGVRGGLYVDQTGTWSNELIVATSDSSYLFTNQPVWRGTRRGIRSSSRTFSLRIWKV